MDMGLDGSVGAPTRPVRDACPDHRSASKGSSLAVIDVAGFVADLKSHAIDHGFHVHDERHFVETYSLRQTWEVDLHPEEACHDPVDLHLALDVDPRALLGFEDELSKLDAESTALTRDNDRLKLELATLKSPARLETIARTKLGMGPPAAASIIHLPPLPRKGEGRGEGSKR